MVPGTIAGVHAWVLVRVAEGFLGCQTVSLLGQSLSADFALETTKSLGRTDIRGATHVNPHLRGSKVQNKSTPEPELLQLEKWLAWLLVSAMVHIICLRKRSSPHRTLLNTLASRNLRPLASFQPAEMQSSLGGTWLLGIWKLPHLYDMYNF